MTEAIRRAESTSRFEKSLKRYVGRNRRRQQCVSETIKRMEKNLFDPRLKTHPLTGTLSGFHACSCGYDCRIVFAIERKDGIQKIVLIAVGTHDEVY